MKEYKMKINGQNYDAKVVKYDGSSAKVVVNGIEYKVDIDTESLPAAPKLVRSQKVSPNVSVSAPPAPKAKAATAGAKDIVAPIPGTIMDIKVKEGDNVNADDVVIILEAMKMESEITSSFAGTVKKINCSKGESVQEGSVLVELGD